MWEWRAGVRVRVNREREGVRRGHLAEFNI